MLKNKSVFWGAAYSLLAAIFFSLIFSSLFGKLYLFIFKPVYTCGLSGLGCSDFLGIIQNSIFAFTFFLPLFVMLAMREKQWLIWLILIFIPFTIFLVGGIKFIIWFIIFTLSGGLLGWLINLVIKKFKK